jgi:hypothetical protein
VKGDDRLEMIESEFNGGRIARVSSTAQLSLTTTKANGGHRQCFDRPDSTLTAAAASTSRSLLAPVCVRGACRVRIKNDRQQREAE